MNYRHLTTTAAMLLAFVLAGPAHAQIFIEDFNDDSGDLNGQTVTSGNLTWALSTKGETAGRTLTTGAAFGQASVGAGDAESGALTWKGNMLNLGAPLSDSAGVWTLGVDLKKDHQAGVNHEITVNLRSSSQNKETVIIYKNDRLSTGGSWFQGADIGVAFGTPGNIHVDLVLDMSGASVDATMNWFEIGNPGNNGSVGLGSIAGTLMYDELHLLTHTGSGKTVGYDNLSLVPEPATFTLVGLSGAVIVARRRRTAG